jgi:hypothetical protein
MGNRESWKGENGDRERGVRERGSWGQRKAGKCWGQGKRVWGFVGKNVGDRERECVGVWVCGEREGNRWGQRKRSGSGRRKTEIT